MNKAKVTILTGTYNNTDILSQTIDSVLESDFSDFQIVIVDDNYSNSLDLVQHNRRMIESYNDQRIIYYKNDNNIGVPFVFLKWVSLVSTPYFIACGEGDVFTPGALRTMVEFLDREPECSLVYGHEYFNDPLCGLRSIKKIELEDGAYSVYDYLMFHLIGEGDHRGWSQASAMYRTDLFKYFSIPVQGFHYWDHYFHCVYLLHSKKIGHINEYFAIRHVDSKLVEWAALNVFTDKFERLVQSECFINENTFKLIRLGHPIDRYRRIIAIKILRRIFLIENSHQFSLLVKIIVRNLFPLILSSGVFLMFSPIIQILRFIVRKKS